MPFLGNHLPPLGLQPPIESSPIKTPQELRAELHRKGKHLS